MNSNGLTVESVDIGTLIDALTDGNRDRQWFFHTSTGDVRADGDWSDGFGEDDLEEQGWVRVTADGGRASFEDMELFASAIGDQRTREVLLQSLEGKGVFRRFREALREYPELKDSWQTWSTVREESRAVRWLLVHEHVDELDAEHHLLQLREIGNEALDGVRGSRGPTLDVADAPGRWAELVAALERGDAVTLTRHGKAFAAITTFDTVDV
jgi:hypothetical protein